VTAPRLLALAAVAAVALLPARTDAAPSAASRCDRPRIGFLGPLTGSAAFIGKEQLGFARYAARRLSGGAIRIVEADTQLDPAQTGRAARALHERRDVLAVVGPAASQEVLAAPRVFRSRERLPFVSASALASGLTNGSIPNFFRVVPNDSAQAPTLASFLIRRLKARSVFVVDDRSRYSRLLADEVRTRLRAAGVRVARASVDQKQTEYGDVIQRIDDSVDAVFLPWQIAASAQVFGMQLREHAKPATIVGGDALDSGDFTIAGSYVATFAPDVRQIPGNEEVLAGYGGRFVSNFGPLAYVATQAAVAAVEKACADGEATRAEVLRRLRATHLAQTLLGRDLEFTANGDLADARFAIFKLGTRGKKTLVGRP
jgi:branched-chain amino acid transport system substrate-binding protein